MYVCVSECKCSRSARPATGTREHIIFISWTFVYFVAAVAAFGTETSFKRKHEYRIPKVFTENHVVYSIFIFTQFFFVLLRPSLLMLLPLLPAPFGTFSFVCVRYWLDFLSRTILNRVVVLLFVMLLFLAATTPLFIRNLHLFTPAVRVWVRVCVCVLYASIVCSSLCSCFPIYQ